MVVSKCVHGSDITSMIRLILQLSILTVYITFTMFTFTFIKTLRTCGMRITALFPAQDLPAIWWYDLQMIHNMRIVERNEMQSSLLAFVFIRSFETESNNKQETIAAPKTLCKSENSAETHLAWRIRDLPICNELPDKSKFTVRLPSSSFLGDCAWLFSSHSLALNPPSRAEHKASSVGFSDHQLCY